MKISKDPKSECEGTFVCCSSYDDALNMVLRQRESYEVDGASGDLSGRLVVYQILIQIARGDEIAAQKVLRDNSGWLDQEQYDIMSTLLKASKL